MPDFFFFQKRLISANLLKIWWGFQGGKIQPFAVRLFNFKIYYCIIFFLICELYYYYYYCYYYDYYFYHPRLIDDEDTLWS